MLYAADRLLDARNATDIALEERHRFHRRHRRVFVPLIALTAIAVAALTPDVFPEALRLFALLGAVLCGWFMAIHTRLAHERRLPKELAVGLFFAAAIFIPTVARRPDLRLSLLAPAVLFASVCALNCMYLYAWEHPADRLTAHWTTLIATRHLSALCRAVLVAAILCSFWFAISHSAPGVAPWAMNAACALSLLLLLWLNRQRAALSPLHVRAAADLALLTPLIFIPFLRAQR